MTLQEELDTIRARQAYGINRASDSNREGEILATLILAGAAMALAPFAAIIKGIIQCTMTK